MGYYWDVIISRSRQLGYDEHQCLSNMNDMVASYDKPVMICEVGMSWDQAAACKSFLADLINKVRSVSGNKGLGVFYWEPQMLWQLAGIYQRGF